MGLSIVAAKVRRGRRHELSLFALHLESVSHGPELSVGSPSLPVDGACCGSASRGGVRGRVHSAQAQAAQGRRPAVGGSCRQCDLDTESLALLRNRWRQNLMNHNRHRRRGGPLVRDGSEGSHGVRARPRTAPGVLLHTCVPAHSSPRPPSASPSRHALPVGVRGAEEVTSVPWATCASAMCQVPQPPTENTPASLECVVGSRTDGVKQGCRLCQGRRKPAWLRDSGAWLALETLIDT